MKLPGLSPGVVLVAGCLSACVSFQSDVSITRNNANRMTASRFELIGFHYDPKLKQVVKDELTKHSMIEEASGKEDGAVLEVSKEHLQAGGAWQILNALLTIASGGLIPFYHPVKSTMKMRLESSECSFQFAQHEFVSLIALPFMPFFWPARRERDQYLEAVQKALELCL